MKIIRTKGTEYIIRLDRGDRWPNALVEAFAEIKLGGAFFYGVGGVENPEVGYYDLPVQKYMTKKFEGIFEVVSITGNVSELNGTPVVHSHGVFSGPGYSVFGGHFVSGIVAGTLELFVSDVGGTIKRKADPRTGLTILASD